MHPPHPLQTLWDTQLAGVRADALRTALECALFDHLDDFTTADALAAKLHLHAANTGYLLELLWSMQLLERTATRPWRWRNRPLARRWLGTHSDESCAQALLYRHRVLRTVGEELGQALRQGASGLSGPSGPSGRADNLQNAWAQAARVQIFQEQRAVTAPAACALCATLPSFAHARRLLDVGGGPGLVAMALARMQPQLGGVVFEQAAVAAVARENIARAGLEGRLQVRSGDLERDAPEDGHGDGFDLVLCFSVLHFVADIPALLARLHRALRPGGVLLCCHGEIPPAADAARRVLPCYLGMRIRGRQVWPQGALARWLAQAGFAPVQSRQALPFALTPMNAVIAHKPANP